MKKVSIITIVITLLSITFSFSQETKKKITLDEIWHQYKFYPKTVHGISSLDNGKQYTMIKNGSLVIYNYATGDSVDVLLQKEKLIPKGRKKPIYLSSYKMSNDGKNFLIPTATESIYRHSKKSDFYIYNKNSDTITLLSNGGKQRLADFNPAGTKVAFVRENNIYIKDLETGNENQITTDGVKNKIINGTCDWVYEEEFGFTKAFFWSPDGNKIAYYRFNERDRKSVV